MNEISIAQFGKLQQVKWTGWLYVSSPFCGTCQQAEKMLTVLIESGWNDSVAKLNIQLAPLFAASNEIESVPALLYYKKGEKQAQLYRFGSMLDLIETIKEVKDHVNGI